MQLTIGKGQIIGTRLYGRWLLTARVGWALVLALTLALFIAGIPPFYRELQTVCSSGCQEAQLSPGAAQALRSAGVSLHFYAVYYIALEAIYVLTFCAVALMLFWHRSSDLLGLLGATMLLLLGGVMFTETITALEVSVPFWRVPITILAFLGSASMIPFFYVFPDGRFVPAWTRWAAIGWAILCALGYFTPTEFPLNQEPTNPSHLFPALAMGFVASVLIAQLYRYHRVATRRERQQMQWVGFGLVAAFGGLFMGVFLIEPRIHTTAPGAVLLRFVGLADFYFFLLLIPVSIAVAVLRHRLWDIDVIINRTLVYGSLTAAVAGIYVLVVGYLGALFRTDANLPISLVATGLVAVLFAPLRVWLQRGVNRLLYGERDDPYLVLARLGHRLESALAPDTVLSTITATIRETLKLPYAAIALPHDSSFRVASASGQQTANCLKLPLSYQGETVGELVLGARSGEEFGDADRRLLADLAVQAGLAVHGVRVMADLQASREKLVLAREEERRRLRRDLHDELAPTLAALGLTAATVGELIPHDPGKAALVNKKLQAALRETVGSVRRLVYDLRPPALDELGLVDAVRERASQHGFEVVVPKPLPTLPAAVEVAAYRIVQESIANVSRHAQADHCVVRMEAHERWLEVEVVDDGVGLPDGYEPGVGLRSMGERAEELGGVCRAERLERGTRVFVRLPVKGGAQDGS